tara:strand:+ start:1410 stop:1559 length:150 start_codon:yes stop_codon:yes gene_type:complete
MSIQPLCNFVFDLLLKDYHIKLRSGKYLLYVLVFADKIDDLILEKNFEF